jgi:type II secretory pathway component PulC
LYERDEFAGLKIVPGTNRGQLARLELQAGDIVRSIDGKRLKSPDKAWQTLDDAISTGTPIVVSIEREGTLMSISLDGSKLSEPANQVNSFEPLAQPAGT